MKLASYKHGRDGRLMVVNNDLSKATPADKIAPTLQYALENWADCRLPLEQLSRDLDNGKAVPQPFDPRQCASPLPRAYQWADGSAYVNHVELVRKARGVDMPPSFWTDPLMYQGGSDSFLAPHDDIVFAQDDWGIDFEGEVAVITDDVPMGTTAADAGAHIKLVMLVNDVTLRQIAQPELTKGFGFYQSKPSSAFSPVAVTPQKLGNAWKDNKLHLPLYSYWNGEKFGAPDAGVDMVFDFAQLIAHAARTRPLCAGTIIGSGTVSNIDRSLGHSCIVEKRMLEKIEHGDSKTPFMKFGDTVKIEMLDQDGKSIFGAIEQTVARYEYVSSDEKRAARRAAPIG
ncbi:MAG: fumarylacetoacetate hydrolase family protein [Bdellovibrionales bacterium]|jgi:fumarylacetoacetate (FAA) hydrolase|nr:fumarylacetoacetate hydrolase family protein [Bdellovibrionales bacterium]